MLAAILFSLSSSHVFSTNLKIKIYKTMIVPVILYGCATWSLTLKEEHRVDVFENRVLRRIFEPKRKWHKDGEDYIMSSFITFMLQLILFG
jgi:hypothetical protein